MFDLCTVKYVVSSILLQFDYFFSDINERIKFICNYKFDLALEINHITIIIISIDEMGNICNTGYILLNRQDRCDTVYMKKLGDIVLTGGIEDVR